MNETAQARAEKARRALDLVAAESDEIRRLPFGPRPLSFQQERLWFLEQMEPTAPIYNVARALRLDGPLSREALAHAVEAVIARHDTLRTWIDGEPDEPDRGVRSRLPDDVRERRGRSGGRA